MRARRTRSFVSPSVGVGLVMAALFVPGAPTVAQDDGADLSALGTAVAAMGDAQGDVAPTVRSAPRQRTPSGVDLVGARLMTDVNLQDASVAAILGPLSAFPDGATAAAGPYDIVVLDLAGAPKAKRGSTLGYTVAAGDADVADATVEGDPASSYPGYYDSMHLLELGATAEADLSARTPAGDPGIPFLAGPVGESVVFALPSGDDRTYVVGTSYVDRKGAHYDALGPPGRAGLGLAASGPGPVSMSCAAIANSPAGSGPDVSLLLLARVDGLDLDDTSVPSVAIGALSDGGPIAFTNVTLLDAGGPGAIALRAELPAAVGTIVFDQLDLMTAAGDSLSLLPGLTVLGAGAFTLDRAGRFERYGACEDLVMADFRGDACSIVDPADLTHLFPGTVSPDELKKEKVDIPGGQPFSACRVLESREDRGGFTIFVSDDPMTLEEIEDRPRPRGCKKPQDVPGLGPASRLYACGTQRAAHAGVHENLLGVPGRHVIVQYDHRAVSLKDQPAMAAAAGAVLLEEAYLASLERFGIAC